MSTYKLYYFDARGVAEPIRLLFAYANVKFEEVRFARGPEWSQLKPKMPWNVVPVLEVDGEQLSQSRAIVRFLAKRFGLLPTNELEAAKCDEYVESIVDLRTEGKKFHREQDPNNKETLKNQFISDKLSQFMNKLDEILRKNSSGYFVGSQLSYADIFIAYTIEQIMSWIDVPNTLDNYPEVKKHHDRIMALPGIKKWVQSRPKTQS